MLGNTAIRKRVNEVGRENIAISVITQGEMFYMAHKSEQKKGNLRRTQLFINEIDIYEINGGTASLYGQFKAELIQYYGPKERNKLRRTTLDAIGISDNDLWIASTAVYNGLSVISTDSDFLRMQPALKSPLASWL